MAHLDAACKHSMEKYPQDWAAWLGVAVGVRVEAIDADRSTIGPRLDKLFRVLAKPVWYLVCEPHGWDDPDLDNRMFYYSAVARHVLKADVHVVAVLLFKRAWGPKNKGHVRTTAFGDSRVDFTYQTVKLWEQPVESILTAGIGLLPLAPLCDVKREEMPEVISRMGERIDAELNPAEAGELWTAAGILMSVPFGKDFAVQMLRNRSHLMEDSPFYQYILDQGIEKGLEKGLEKGRREGETGALQSAVLHLGQKKFGTPPNAVRLAIHAIEDHDVLDALLLKLLDVGNWLDLLENIPEGCATN